MLTLPAPAKINLYLHITTVHSNGMHELNTAFAYTEAHDLLHFEKSNEIVVTCSQQHLSGKANLVHQVLEALQTRYGIKHGLRVHIDKQIPEQAGLGGGSSDAATAIMAANTLWDIHASSSTLIDFATPFGADIPCFLYGKASLATGIGASLIDYPYPLPGQTLLLARPETGLSTAQVFRHFDSTLTDLSGLATMRRDSPCIGDNDLEASACLLNPDVAQLLTELRTQTEEAWMSGSGSTCVALFDNHHQALKVSDFLQQKSLANWTHVGKICDLHPIMLNR
ncbi:4-(cytidine 5'-diphospho)-2-C-methyl-D-erythritol kinase [Mariprofundus sp. EBB-1]|uniref:4-(cytidine 5'-diphospho)-2-C-methyl-D-erythritol kinase n=1 Tax=Mariprofundus sp. EBB-1 TaxID=2650971 RepID=UPI002106139E|nr:4-(cytidine 5'-diphospho)-2-C-methyl-D-erythritol kinase [Mariprofundus sp. EBB-1]